MQHKLDLVEQLCAVPSDKGDAEALAAVLPVIAPPLPRQHLDTAIRRVLDMRTEPAESDFERRDVVRLDHEQPLLACAERLEPVGLGRHLRIVLERLEHHVRAVAVHAECAYARTSRTFGAIAQPVLRVRRSVQTVPELFQLRAGIAKIPQGRKDFLMHTQAGLHKAGQSGGRARVADIGFRAADHSLAILPRPKQTGQRLHLHEIFFA